MPGKVGDAGRLQHLAVGAVDPAQIDAAVRQGLPAAEVVSGDAGGGGGGDAGADQQNAPVEAAGAIAHRRQGVVLENAEQAAHPLAVGVVGQQVGAASPFQQQVEALLGGKGAQGLGIDDAEFVEQGGQVFGLVLAQHLAHRVGHRDGVEQQDGLHRAAGAGGLPRRLEGDLAAEAPPGQDHRAVRQMAAQGVQIGRRHVLDRRQQGLAFLQAEGLHHEQRPVRPQQLRQRLIAQHVAAHRVEADDRRLAAVGVDRHHRMPVGAAGPRLDALRQAGDGGMGEQVGERQAQIEGGLDFRQQAHRQHAVAAQGEEVGFRVLDREAQNLGPQGGEALFGVVGGGRTGLADGAGLGRGRRASSSLPLGLRGSSVSVVSHDGTMKGGRRASSSALQAATSKPSRGTI